MNRALLYLLVFSAACQGSLALAEGAGLEIDKEALAELQADEKQAATNVIKRVEEVRNQFADQSQSKFSKMKALFAKATPVSSDDFKGEVAFAGQCITKAAEETFFPSMANLYVEKDPLLGKQIYFMPKVSEGGSSEPDYLRLETPAMRTLHDARRGEKNNFSALQFGLGKDAPLSEVMPVSQKNSAFFTYRAPARSVAGVGGGARPETAATVLFSVRMDRAPNGMPYVIMQRLCPYSTGCQMKGSGLVDYLNFVDAYSYCYYSRLHYLVRGR